MPLKGTLGSMGVAALLVTGISCAAYATSLAPASGPFSVESLAVPANLALMTAGSGGTSGDIATAVDASRSKFLYLQQLVNNEPGLPPITTMSVGPFNPSVTPMVDAFYSTAPIIISSTSGGSVFFRGNGVPPTSVLRDAAGTVTFSFAPQGVDAGLATAMVGIITEPATLQYVAGAVAANGRGPRDTFLPVSPLLVTAIPEPGNLPLFVSAVLLLVLRHVRTQHVS